MLLLVDIFFVFVIDIVPIIPTGAKHNHVRLNAGHHIPPVLIIPPEVILEVHSFLERSQFDSKNLVNNINIVWPSLGLLEFQQSIFPQQRQNLAQLSQLVLVQDLQVLEDKLAAYLLQLLVAELLCQLRNFQNILFACVPGGNERSNSILEILHEIEIGHGQKTFGTLEAVVFRYPYSIDEVQNCSQDLWGTLLYLENLAVVLICSVELLKSLEVPRPGIKDN